MSTENETEEVPQPERSRWRPWMLGGVTMILFPALLLLTVRGQRADDVPEIPRAVGELVLSGGGFPADGIGSEQARRRGLAPVGTELVPAKAEDGNGVEEMTFYESLGAGGALADLTAALEEAGVREVPAPLPVAAEMVMEPETVEVNEPLEVEPQTPSAAILQAAQLSAQSFDEAAGLVPEGADGMDDGAVSVIVPIEVDTAVATEPTMGGSGPFALQVASLSRRESAVRMQKRLADKGFEAYLMEADLGGKGVWWRVRVGHFETRNAAKWGRLELVREGLDPIVVRNPNQ